MRRTTGESLSSAMMRIGPWPREERQGPSPVSGSVEDQIAAAVAHKCKKGTSYAVGKDLVVFSEAIGEWHPNKAARRIVGAHRFKTVWVVHLEKGNDCGYSYCVSWLGASNRNAPSWRVSINGDFSGWSVDRIQ